MNKDLLLECLYIAYDNLQYDNEEEKAEKVMNYIIQIEKEI